MKSHIRDCRALIRAFPIRTGGAGGLLLAVLLAALPLQVVAQDSPVSIEITSHIGGTYTTIAEGETANFTVRRTGDKSEALAVQYATSGSNGPTSSPDDAASAVTDFTGASGSHTFPAGSSDPLTFSVETNEDSLYEPWEYFTVTVLGSYQHEGKPVPFEEERELRIAEDDERYLKLSPVSESALGMLHPEFMAKEGGISKGKNELTISLNETLPYDLHIDYAVGPDPHTTATSRDFTMTGTERATILAGRMFQTIDIGIVDDDEVEPTEYFTLRLLPPKNETQNNAAPTYKQVPFNEGKIAEGRRLSVSIMDNDTAEMRGVVHLRGEGGGGIAGFPSTRKALTEGLTVTITAEVAGEAPSNNIKIPLKFVHYPMDEATSDDYSIDEFITIKSGEKSGNVTLKITDNDGDERYRELLVVEIDDMSKMMNFPTGYKKGDRYQYEVIMLDNDKTGTKLQGLSKMKLSETSGNRTTTFQIEMDRLPKKDTPAGAPFSVTVAEGDPTFKLEYSGSDKRATRNNDYMSPVEVPGKDCSTSGEKLTCTVTFMVKNDDLYEGGKGTYENVSIELKGVEWENSDGIENTGSNLSLTIEDNDLQPMLSIGDETATEGDKVAFEVKRTGAMENKLSVRAATATDGTDGAIPATANSDYSTRAGTLEFKKNELKQTFEVTTTQDVIDEMPETFLVNLSMAKDTGGEPKPAIATGTAVGTIEDNDDAPTELTISVDTNTIAEAAGKTTVSVTATIDSPTRFATDQTVTVTVGNPDNAGEASDGDSGDYETVDQFTITIPATEASGKGTFELTPLNDRIDDDDEKISVEGELGEMTVTHTAITIVDDDTRGITVDPVTLTLNEADDTSTSGKEENKGTYEVALTSQPEGGTITVNITNPGPTVATVEPSSLTFDKDNWETAQPVTVIANNDTIDNTGNQKTTTISHTVSADGTGYAGEDVEDVEVTVTDNDESPTALTITVDTDTGTDGNQDTIGEGASNPTVRITATLDGETQFATDKTITITVGDAEDTATEGTGGDYNTVAEFNITLPAGDESVSHDLTLNLNNDTVDEADEETVTVTGELADVTVKGTTFTIEDDDDTPTVTLVLTPASINESGSTNASTVKATMDGKSSEAVTLTVAATPVSPAVAGDLTLSDNKTLTIPANTLTSTGAVTIAAVDNDVDAADKTVTVSATATGGNDLVQAPGNQTLTITDDDTRGITVSKASLTLDEVDNTATTEADEHQDIYTVVLDSEPSGGTVTIGVASDDTNIAGVAPATLTFTASNWDEAQTVTVSAVLDGIDNPNDRRTAAITHTVTATGTDYDGATASGVTVTVNDDDGAPTLSINSPSVTEVDSGAAATLTFTVQLLPKSGNTVTVAYADADTGTATSGGTDYATLVGGTLTFNPDDTSKPVAVTVSGDDIDELDETVVVRLSSPSNATLPGGATTLDGTGTITDNDPTPTVSVADAAAVSEGNVATPNPANNMTFTVTLSAVSGLEVTVPYTLSGTATAGTDYTEPDPRSVTIAAGTMQANIEISVAGDEVDEENETITVTLGTPTNATVSTAEGAGAASGTITDDDTRGVSVTPTALTVAEADNAGTAATREDQETYKVVLTSQPTGAVTVNLNSGDESVARIDTASLVFDADDWNTERTVTVTGQADVIDNTGDERTTTIAHTVSAVGTDYASEAAEGVTVTVTDDDAAPSGITLTANPDSVTENGGAKTITVTAAVNGATRYAQARTVSVSVGGGTAISGTDYTAVVSFDITIGAGEDDANNTFTLTPTNDVLAEGSETIDVTGTLSGITITPDEITLTDDDAAPSGITLSVDTNGAEDGTPDTVAEDAGATVVTVTATVNGTTRYVDAKTVVVSVADGTADSPADYAAVSGFNITIAAGAASQSGSFTVTPVDDDLDESNETIDVTGTLSSVTITGATVTFTDNDDPVSFSIADAETTEGGKVTFTVSRTGAGDNVAEVKVATAADSGDDVNAADADDYTAIATAQTLNFAKDITSQTVEVQTTQDDLFEPDETFKAVLSDPALADGDPGTGVSIESGKGTAIGTIKNDDTQPSFAVANASASEGNDITFTVTRSGAMDNAVSVKWNTKADSSDGANAASTTDYTPVTAAQTLSFAKGVGTQTFTVATTEDALDEENETFLVELTGAVGGTITTAQATGTITDDDAAPTGITLSVDTNGSTSGTPSTVAENAGATVVTVTATVNGTTRYVDAKTVAVSVVDDTAASPADYAAVSDFSITIAAGAASHTGNFTVTPVDDDLNETNETIDVTGTLTDISITDATVTFTDNDDPVSFSIADAEATEGGKVTFTVSRAGAGDNVASVKIATAADSGDGVNAADADDYTAIATAQTLNFAKGVTSQMVEVQTTQDDLFEPDETFKAVLSEPALADGDPGTEVSIESGKGTAIGTIKNDDTEPSFAVADASASEGNAITFTVTRSGAMDNAVSVKWNTKADSSDGANAASASDYTPVTTATTLTFAKGVGTQTFTVATTEDVLAEGTETFLVELTEAAGGTIDTAEATGTINDDDAAPTGITLSVDTNGSTAGTPSTVAEDAGATVVTVTATVNGTTRYVDAKTVAVSVVDDTAASPADYAAVSDFSITIAAGAASHTGNFTVTPVDDDLNETNETIDVTGTLTDISITDATVTFTDNDDPVSFSIADAEATEGGKVTFTVSRAGAGDNVASVKIATAADSGDGVNAADADDYTAIATAQTLNFAKGVTSQMVEVQTTQDDLFEPDETFKAVLSEPALADGDPGTEVSIESGKGTAIGTIKNDDTEPSFAVADASASEGNAITFTVTRSGAMDNAVSVKWNTKADSSDGANAASASDYTPVTTATTLTFAKGVGTQTFTVATTEDVLAEGTETFLVELTEAAGGTIDTAEATGTINDDDAAPTGITLSVDTNGSTAGTPSTVAEDAGATVVTVTATVNGTTRYVDAKTVAVSVVDDTAASPADYAAVSDFSITIAAGAASHTGNFTVTPVDDDLNETNETIDVTGTLTDISITDATVTFTDNDDPVSFSIADAEATEGGKVTFTVSRAGAGDNVASVKIATAADSGDGVNAADADDYTAIATAQTLNFAKGVTSQMVEVQTTQDDLFEPDETFKAVLSEPALADGDPGTEVSIESGKGTAIGTIKNDDTQPSFAVADASASEGDAITFTVTRSGAMDNAVSVKWNTKADSSDGAHAASASDYTPVSTATTLTFVKGEGTQTFTVATTEDVLHEGNETFLVELTGAVGGTIATAEATGTITDDDAAPTGITLSVDTNGAEDGTPKTVAEDAGATVVTVTATVNGTTRYVDAKTVAVSVADGTAASPADYAAVSGFNITIAAGVASQTGSFTVTPVDDDLNETNETIDVTGTLTDISITDATVTFTDNDDPVSFSIADAEATEGGKVTFTVNRGGAEDNVASVKVATAADSGDGVNAADADDYTAIATAQTLNFAKGVTSQMVEVQTTQDDLFEPDETFKAVLSAPALGDGDPGTAVSIATGKGTATGTIKNDDTQPSFAVADASASEGDAITFTVTRSGAMDNAVSVKWNTKADSSDGAHAASASDYTPVTTATTLTFVKGEGTQTFTVATTEDVLHEGNETFLVELTGAVGGTIATAEATGTINDDDAAPGAITISVDTDTSAVGTQTTIAENGGAKTVRVTATITDATRFVEAKTVTLEVGVTADSATESTDYTEVPTKSITINAGAASGYVDFTLTPTDDTLHEGSETISLDGTLTGVTVTDATITLTDDDGAPTALTLSVDADTGTNNVQTSLTENGGAKTVRVTATLGGSSTFTEAKTVTLEVGADTDSATEGADYTEVETKSFTINAGASNGYVEFTLTPTDDTRHETSETISLDGTLDGVTVTDASLLLTDNDAAPTTLTLAVDADNATENVQTSLAENGGAKTVKVTATLGGSTQFDVDKTVTLIVGDDDDSATDGTDYTTVDNITLTIPAGDQDVEHTFTLTPTNDAFREGTETISFDATLTGVTVSGASITLTSDDAAPAITLTVDADKDTDNVQTSLAEDGGVKTVRVTATLDGTTRLEEAADLTLAVGKDGDTAEEGTDYTTVADRTISIGAGVASVTHDFTLTPTNDNLYEGTETISLDGTLTGVAVTDTSLTLTDDDAQPSFAVADASASEGDAITFTVTRSGAMDNAVSVKWNTKADTSDGANAASVTDYTAMPTATKLDFAKGVGTQTFTVATTEDVLHEGAETFLVELTEPTGAIISDAEATGTITDDDAAPSGITLSVDTNGAEDGTPNTVAEDAGDTVVTVTATVNGTTRYVDAKTVAVSVADNTAVSPADYAAVSSFNITIAAGAASHTGSFTVTPVDDNLDESNETIDVTGTLTDITITGATVTFTNTDDPVSFSIAYAEATEGGKVTFTVNRAGAGDNVASVKVATAADSGDGVNAAGTSDYTVIATAQTLNFAKGVTSQTVEVQTTQDDLFEPDETFKAVLSAPALGDGDPGTGVSIESGKGTATGTIKNDDTQPSFAVADASASEGDAITFTVTRSGAMDNAVSVKWNTKADTSDGANAASVTDYTAMPTATKLDFAKGVGTQTFTVATTEDVLHEGAETFLVELTEPTGAIISDAEATGTITDDDAASSGITLTVSPNTVGEGDGETEITVTATVNGTTRYPDAHTVTISVGGGTATSDTDYDAVANFDIVIAAGDASKAGTFDLTPTDDDLHEGSETIDVTGTSGALSITKAEITLTDNDGQPSFAVADASAAEGDAITFTVTRTGAMDNAVSVKWNTKAATGDGAASTNDYTAMTTATKLDFAKGVGTQTFTVATTEDTLNEGNETFLIELTEPVGATIADAEATGTITNDDAAPTTLTLAVDADNATENVQTSLAENGGAKTVKVTATLGGSTQFDVDKTVTLIVGDDDDSATDGTDYTTVDNITLTIPAGDQDVEHTFTLTPTNDAFREGTETISFDATLTGVTVSGASITLTSDDAAPAITLTVDADKDTDNVQTSLAEDGGVKTVRVTATLDGTTRLEEAADLTLAVGKDGDTAEEGTDYTTVADRTISIGAGVASVTHDFTLTPTNDNLYEGTETISLDGTLTGVAVTDTSLTLTDDDAQPSFAVADASASEGDAITFTVTRSGAMDNAVSVKWNTKADTSDGANAASVTDYTAMPTATKLDFAKGVGTQTFTVATTEDVLHEGAETFLVELTEPTGAIISDAEATGTITDDDAASSGITLTVSPNTVGEGDGETEITVTATVNGTTRYPDAHTVTISVGGGTATSDTDYDAVANFDIVIAAGDASKAGTFDLTPTDDDLHEGSETIDVTGTSGALSITKAEITLTDNDGQPSFAVADASAAEGDAITFTVTRTGAMDNAVSVKWNTKAATGDGAASTNDYTAMTTATKLDFAKGVGTQTFTVATTEDTLNEGNETFLIELTEPVGATIADAEATGTITNDDAAPTTLTLAVDADNATENVQTSLAENGGAKTVKVTATLGGSTQFDVDKTVTLIVGDDDDSATDGTDYTTVDNITLTIPAGDQDVEHTFTLTPTNDAFREGTETISFDATLTGVTVSGASITLTSDDAAPAITLTVDADKDTDNVQTSLAEDGGVKTVRVTATLDGTTRLEEAADLTLAVGKDGDTAEEGTDYTTVADRTISIGAGVASVTHDFTLTPTNDNLYEGTETISLDGTLTGVAVTDTSLTLTDDDAQPSFAVADASASEGDAITFTVTRSGAMDNAVSVKWNTKADTSDGANAASVTDYTAMPTATKLDFAKGVGTQTFTVATTEDVLHEGAETFLVELTEPTGAIISDAEATGTITDDDAASSGITLTVSPNTVGEGDGETEITVTATVNGTTRYPDAHTVTISVGGGTATSDTDYDAVANFDIVIAAGDASKAGTFDLTPTDDDLHEGSETIDVTGTSGALSITKAEITLTDNDGQPSFAVADASAAEGDAITFTVTRTGAMDNAVSVKWNTKADTSDGANAASATDYTPATTATKLDFVKGVGTQTFTVATTEDTLNEGNETFLIELTEPVGATIADAEATGTITNDDAAPSGITLTVSPNTVGEEDGETEITVTATVNGTTRYPDAHTVTISVGGGTATSDTDYDAVANFDIVIAAGDASKTGTFDLTPTDDDLHEGSETIDVTGTSGALGITKAEITLTDNDGQPSFAVADASAAEGDAITFTVTRTGAMDNAVSVKWNTKADTGAGAASTSDYTAMTTATKLDFAKGEGTQTFTVATTEDNLHEGAETFLVELTEPVGAVISDAEATGTITNDDAAPSGITLTVSPATVGEGAGETEITVTATVNGTTRYVGAKTVTISVGGGTAISGTDYDAVVNFDIIIAAGDSSKAGTFDLTPAEDFLDEINETINVTGASGSLTITPATVTITDATEPPTATLVLTPTTINESGATNSSTVTATLSGESSATVTLTVDAVAGANTAASDFTVSANKTLTIAAGATTSTGTVTITAVDNDADAPDKSVTVSATTSGGGVSNPTDQTLTITDDEATPTATLVLTPATINESGETNASTVTATLSGESSSAVTVEVSVPNTAPVTLSSNTTLTITAGATTSTGTVTITAVDNNVDAPDKTVTVSATASGGSVADPADQTLSINDDEGVPTATLVLTPGTINETGATNSSTVTATLSGKSSAAVTLMVAAVAGANTAASDFTVSANKTLTIAAGATTSTGAVTITAVDNNVDAPDKSVTVSATTSGGGVSDPTDQTLTITDDEATPTVTLVLTPATINESGATNASTVTATLSGKSSAAVTVEVSVPNTAPVTLSSNTILSIAAGAKTSTGTVTITAVDNNVDAPNETVTVSAAAIGGVAIPVIETLTINDDDVAPTGITLTVSPATIRETDGETEITVTATVNGTTRYADAKTVTVSVGDGTATSGMDYDAVSNFDIIIAAGDTSNTGTFDLMLINDAVQEKDETIEITGSSGALNITKAMITITNSDPMPAAWLGRFGRTVAEQALDGIAGRIAASRSAGVQGSIAGHALNFDSPYSGSEALPRLDPRAGAGGTGVESSTTNDTTTLNNLVNNNVQERSELTLTSGDSGIDAFDTDGQTSRSYTMTGRELLLGSSFTATGEKDVSGGSLASWGRTAQSSFDGREGTLSLDGEATTTMLGVDYARDHWLVGMALMQSNGKGGYQDSETELRAASPACSTTENGTEQGTCNGAVRDGEGEIEATLTAVTPYAAIQTSENLKLWGTLGHGTGEVTLTPVVGDPLKADISWTMAAVGLRSDIIVPRKNSTELGPLSDSGLALALTADALWARTSSNRTHDMVESDSDVTRLRFGLQGSYQITLKQGGSVTPRLEVGVRQDGGSAETGLGIELVGGLSWLDPTLGLSIDLSGRTLIVHSSDDLKNQSFAVAFAWDPDPATQRGPSLKFSQQWGTIALGGLDTPFGPDSIEDLGDSENTARWQADAAWGFPIFGGSFTGSPHVGVGLASDTRDYSLGWRLTPAANANAPDLSFAVKATRQESDTAPPEHSIGFVLIFRW